MIKTLLIASALALPALVGTAHAGCGPSAGMTYECDDDDDVDENLTTAERAQVERLQAQIEQIRDRADDRAARVEAARRAKCTVPWLKIGCPTK